MLITYQKIQSWKRRKERISFLKEVATFIIIAIAFLAVLIWTGKTFPY